MLLYLPVGSNLSRLSSRLTEAGGVISVQTSLYGRADNVTCIQGKSRDEISNTGCSVEGATDEVKKRYDRTHLCGQCVILFTF